jgi:hypothetical protein
MRSGVIVIEPTLRSQRPAQLPPVISVQSGVTKQGSTPSAAAIASRRIDVKAGEFAGGALLAAAFGVRRALRVGDQFRLRRIGRVGGDAQHAARLDVGEQVGRRGGIAAGGRRGIPSRCSGCGHWRGAARHQRKNQSQNHHFQQSTHLVSPFVVEYTAVCRNSLPASQRPTPVTNYTNSDEFARSNSWTFVKILCWLSTQPLAGHELHEF